MQQRPTTQEVGSAQAIQCHIPELNVHKAPGRVRNFLEGPTG